MGGILCPLVILVTIVAIPTTSVAQEGKDIGLQLAENPPMEVIKTNPPEPATNIPVDLRSGFVLISSLVEFRGAIKKDGQKIRLKPGIYRVTDADIPTGYPAGHEVDDVQKNGQKVFRKQEHLFAVTGSNNYFDLRGVVFETPVSVQSKLSMAPHVASSWDIDGSNNTFEGGYFRNIDMPYPTYRVTENEVHVCNDHNTFLNCTFVIQGSVPYGYSDYYGKGGPNFGLLNKHAWMCIDHANHTSVIGCQIYMQTFGHCLHFHHVDEVLINKCLICGTLRPTNDIFKEVAGRAQEYNFQVMYRGPYPIPHDEIIPLTEDAIRAYEEVRNITVIDTTVMRQRGLLQLCGPGDYRLENVTTLEAGDFCYDISAGNKGKVVMKNCYSDVAYNPVFNLTRGDCPKNAFYELTILSPAEGVKLTSRSSLGVICGDACTFILHDGTTRPLPPEVNYLVCGQRFPLVNSSVTNETTAKLILNKNVSYCVIKSHGPVEDHGRNNTVVKIN